MSQNESRSTLMLIPQDTNRVLRFRLNDTYIKLFKWFGIVMMLLAFYVVFQYLFYLKNQWQFNELKRVNYFQLFQLQDSLNRLNKDSLLLRELSRFDEKLRLILDFKVNSKTESKQKLDKLNGMNFKDEVAKSNQIFGDGVKLVSMIEQTQNEVAVNLATRQESFLELKGLIIDSKKRLQATPSIKPVRLGYLTSRYGMRIDPFTGAYRMHHGIDWAYLPYTAIYATADGVVDKSYYSNSYGHTIVINHGNGVKTLYAHMAERIARPGNRIKRGEILGRMGNTGKRSTATHIHYEVRVNNKPVDPASFILEELPEETAQFFVEF